MGQGGELKCKDCGYSAFVSSGGGMMPIWRVMNNSPYLCGACKEIVEMTVYSSMREIEDQIKITEVMKYQSVDDRGMSKDEIIEELKSVIDEAKEQARTGVCCENCGSKDIKEIDPEKKMPCPKCGSKNFKGNMDICFD